MILDPIGTLELWLGLAPLFSLFLLFSGCGGMCFIPPFRVNAINGESIIRYPFFWDLLFSVEGLREGKISGSITCLAFQVRL